MSDNDELLEAIIKELHKKLSEMEQTKVFVALFGQPGAGKSSLMNALIGEDVCPIDVKNDTTKDAQEYPWNGLMLVDLPGYDTEQFPASTFLERFDILKYDILLCVFESKLHDSDIHFFRELRGIGKTCLFVRTKHDTLWQRGKEVDELEQKIQDDVRENLRKNHVKDNYVKIHFVSNRTGHGLAELSNAILNHLDGAKRDRWARSAKAYSREFLEAKKNACAKYIYTASGLAALNGINPVLGLDIAIDMGIVTQMCGRIREAYGLSFEQMSNREAFLGARTTGATKTIRSVSKMAAKTAAEVAQELVARTSKEVLQESSKVGAKSAFRFLGNKAAERATKFVPFVGPAIAASAGFYFTQKAGITYLNDCEELASRLMDEGLQPR